jgi:hypothetical protein
VSRPSPRSTVAVGCLFVAALACVRIAPASAAVVKDISTGINPATGAKVPNNTPQAAYVIAPGPRC